MEGRYINTSDNTSYEPVSAAAPGVNQVVSASGFCPSCGSVANGRFCARCGTQITNAGSPVPGNDPATYSRPVPVQTQNTYGSAPAKSMYQKRQDLLKEIRSREKKMTRTATARIIDKKNDPAYSPILTGNKLNDSYANINWADYEFEVDGKTYSGCGIVHPLHGKTCKILYDPEDPSSNRTKYYISYNRLRSPLMILLIGLAIPIVMILVLYLLGIRFW